jgi:hypothetical protein
LIKENSMRNARLVFAVLMCFAVVTAEAGGQDQVKLDGNHLLPRCQAAVDSLDKPGWKDAHESFNAGYCLGYVEGISAASPDACPGPDVTLSQLERVVVKFLQDNPEKLDRDQGVLVVMALSKAFPCPKK